MSSGNCKVLSCLAQNASEINSAITTSGYLLCENRNDFNSTSNVVKEAYKISNEKQALNFLDHFKWTLSAYVPCNKSHNHRFGYNATKESFVPDHECLGRDVDSIFQETLCSNDVVCECAEANVDTDEVQSDIAAILIPVFLIYGILALIGNSYVIVTKTKYLYRKRRRNVKEKYLFNMLIVNLAGADFLMGIASILSSIIGWRLINPNNIFEDDFCRTMGIFSFVSNQVAISVILIISSFRLFAVVSPYKSIHIRPVMIFMGVIWIFWLLFACFPLFPYFDMLFANGVRNTRHGVGVPTDISFKSIINLIHFFKTNPNIDANFKAVLHVTETFQTPEILFKFLQVLQIISHPNESWEFILFYKKHPRSCFTVITLIGFKEASSWYMLFVFIYIALCSLFTAVSYVILFKRMLEKQSILQCLKSKCCATGNQTQTNKLSQREAENKKLHRTIFLIVLTDMLFWLPLSIAALVYYIFMASETACTYCKSENSIYVFLLTFYMVFMPINSIANPIIYSSKNLWERFYKWLTCNEQYMIESSSSSESAAKNSATKNPVI